MSHSSPSDAGAARQPHSDEEWTIHSLNIHGTFFERWCQRVIAETPSWQVKSTNYPVEFPPFAPQRGHGQESALDVRAAATIGDCLLSLVIECKKNNPEFVNWVFVPPSPATGAHMSSISRFDIALPGTGPINGPPIFTPRIVPLSLPMPLVSDARETRGTYQQYSKGDKTRTSNAAIWDASRQVALATQAVIFEEAQFLSALGTHPGPAPRLYRAQAFLPVIVTTARILACGFDPADVDPRTGEIPFDKAYLEERPYVLYEFPLPRSLLMPPPEIGRAIMSGLWEDLARMCIVVVHSEAFAGFLQGLTQWALGFLQ